MNLSGYYNADANNPYQQDGGYYEGNQHGYQDEYAEQYHDQNPAAGQHGGYAQNGNGYVASSNNLVEKQLTWIARGQDVAAMIPRKIPRLSAISP